jgi:hypothetical protein
LFSNLGLMAEWFKRDTVNIFYRGSNPLKALKVLQIKLYKIEVKLDNK